MGKSPSFAKVCYSSSDWMSRTGRREERRRRGWRDGGRRREKAQVQAKTFSFLKRKSGLATNPRSYGSGVGGSAFRTDLAAGWGAHLAARSGVFLRGLRQAVSVRVQSRDRHHNNYLSTENLI